MRLFRVGDKELGLVRVGARVGHGEDTAVVELITREACGSISATEDVRGPTSSSDLEGGTYLVGEGLAPQALAAFARAGGVAGLDHEAFDVAVPEGVIIVARCAQGEEVLGI